MLYTATAGVVNHLRGGVIIFIRKKLGKIPKVGGWVGKKTKIPSFKLGIYKPQKFLNNPGMLGGQTKLGIFPQFFRIEMMTPPLTSFIGNI